MTIKMTSEERERKRGKKGGEREGIAAEIVRLLRTNIRLGRKFVSRVCQAVCKTF